MNSPLRWMALVALREAKLPDEQAVKTFLDDKYDDAGDATVARATDALLTCTLGEYTAAVTLVTRPIPQSQLEGPCEVAWYWPEAAEALRGHPAHLMIALVDEPGRPIEKSRRLTQLVAAAVDASPSLAVFWGPARSVHPPGAFIEQAVRMTPDDLPLFVWIDFRFERTDAHNVRLFTTGLEALGQCELESIDFPGEPNELLQYAYNLAHYLITSGKSIEEGHTIGLSDEVQAVAHRTKSMFDDSLEVIRLEFQPSDA